MKIRRRNKSCSNCGYILGDVYNFCPNCGQENTDTNVTFSELVRDFVHNYFSLDSRFRNTLKPFLFKPGKITREYNAGRRVSFANPARLYLILSIIYFFVLSGINNYFTSDIEETTSVIMFSEDDQAVETLKGEDVDISDSTEVIEQLDWNMLTALQWNKNFSNKQLLDSMNLELSFWDRRVALQTIKLYRTSTITFKNHLLGNMPIMMVFIVPLFGLLLKMTFRKTGKLYIHHLVHSLHLHSFSYLVYSIGLLLIMVVDNAFVSSLFVVVSLIVVIGYFLKSMRVMYEKTWWGTVWRFAIAAILYLILLIIFLALLLLISFFIF